MRAKEVHKDTDIWRQSEPRLKEMLCLRSLPPHASLFRDKSHLLNQPRLYKGSPCLSHRTTIDNYRTRVTGGSGSQDPLSPPSLALGLGCTMEVGGLPGTTHPCRRHCSLTSGAGSAPSWKRGLEARGHPMPEGSTGRKHRTGGVPLKGHTTPSCPRTHQAVPIFHHCLYQDLPSLITPCSNLTHHS